MTCNPQILTPSQQRFEEFRTRKQAILRQRLQPTFDSPPAIVVLARISHI